MGADVIKVEPPQGCSTRRIPPFVDDLPDADRSLYFIAYQAGKRSVTLNLDSPDGRALLEDLVRKSDFLLESFPVGYMESIGLGYERLAELNPRIIHTSITPFGDTGPGRNYKAADIVSWAAGGPMFLMGDEGRPPLEMSAAAGRTACRRRGRSRLAARALSARDRRQGPARRDRHAGLRRVDPDERAGDADPARRLHQAHRRLLHGDRHAAQDSSTPARTATSRPCSPAAPASARSR